MWYTEKSANDLFTLASHKTHWVFIELFERILSVLSSVLDRRTTQTSEDHYTVNESNDDNYFAALSSILQQSKEEIEPGSSSTTEPLSNGMGRHSRAPEATYTQEVEPESEHAKDDVLFAIYYLFQDLRMFRGFLKSAWTHYQRGNCKLSTISVMNNTVIDIVRGEETRFNYEFPAYQGFEAIKDVVFGREVEKITATYEDDLIFIRSYAILYSYLWNDQQNQVA